MGLFRSAPNFRSASQSPTDARACGVSIVYSWFAARVRYIGIINDVTHGTMSQSERERARVSPQIQLKVPRRLPHYFVFLWFVRGTSQKLGAN